MALASSFIIMSCDPITMTSWKNPKENTKVSNIVVWAMFDKIEYQKPFEQGVANYFNNKGLKTVEGLTFLSPVKKYELPDLEKKFDSIGAEGILIVTYVGTDKTENYVPVTTTLYPDYYYSYYGYYAWGYPMYGPGYGAVTTGGYFATTTVVKLRANLYGNSDNQLLWTSEISLENPEYVDQVSYALAQKIYTDWIYCKLIGKAKK